MNTSYPQWTTRITDITVNGEDQLGIESAAQSYQQEILPGIITVTDHARYYSFYAWILYRFIFNKGSSRLLKDFQGLFFKRHEMMLILSAYLHHNQATPFPGIIGSGINSNKAKNFWGDKESASLDQHYFNNNMGGFGQYYRTAMQAMGILEDQEESRLVYRLTERGKNLAEAYQASISTTQYFQNLETGIVIQTHRAEAEEFAQVGCMCPAALSRGQDRALLLDTFFRFREPNKENNPHVRRRNSLGVALDLIHQAKGQFLREYLGPALYLEEYTPGLRYIPAMELINWVKRWRMVEIRHIFTFGIQCMWAAFLIKLSSELEIRKTDWDVRAMTWLNELQWDIPVRSLMEHFSAEVGFGRRSGLDEYSLYLKATKNQMNSSLLFQTGVQILLQLYDRFLPDYTNHDPIWNELADRPRVPINSYFKHMESHLQKNELLVHDWVAWIYQEYIFEQHEMIALEKLRYQGYDTFKFYFEDGVFHWPIGKKNYREPIRLAGNRLNNCITMLTDLGLILENNEGFLELSEEGAEYRAKVLKGLRDVN